MNHNAELNAALAKAQANVDNAKKASKNPHFKSNYADLATVWDTIREPLTNEGLSVIQVPVTSLNFPGHIGLRTVLAHSSGQSDVSEFYVSLKDASNPQQVGSALTYMKRYALLGIAGIGSEDDDGNAATGRPGPAVTVAAVDYSGTIAETMKHLEKANDVEARALYATVRNSSITQPTKNELLLKMSAFIQERAKATQASDQAQAEKPATKAKK